MRQPRTVVRAGRVVGLLVQRLVQVDARPLKPLVHGVAHGRADCTQLF